MTPFEIQTILDISTLADMKSSRSWGASIYAETLGRFAVLGLVEGPQINLDYPKITERGRAYVDFLQAMPLPVANWAIPAFNPAIPPDSQMRKEGS